MPPPVYLLDTNILLHLIRGKSTGLYIDATFQLQKQTLHAPDLRRLPRRNLVPRPRERLGPGEEAALEVMLSNLVTVDINADQVFDAYVDVEDASRNAPGGAVHMGKNDLWIAAVAKVTGATC